MEAIRKQEARTIETQAETQHRNDNNNANTKKEQQIEQVARRTRSLYP